MMFKVTRKGTNRLDIELSGKLNSEEIQTALDELVDKSKDCESCNREKTDYVYDTADQLDSLSNSQAPSGVNIKKGKPASLP